MTYAVVALAVLVNVVVFLRREKRTPMTYLWHGVSAVFCAFVLVTGTMKLLFVAYGVAASFIAASVWMSIRSFAYAIAARSRRDWPVVDGVVVSATLTREETYESVSSGPRRPITMHSVDVRYEYPIPAALGYREAPATHTGRVPMGASTNAGEWHAKLDAYPIGKRLRVHYDPKHPEVSTLDPTRDVRGGILGAFLCLAFAGFGALFWWRLSRF